MAECQAEVRTVAVEVERLGMVSEMGVAHLARPPPLTTITTTATCPQWMEQVDQIR